MTEDHTPPDGAGEEEALRSLLRGAVAGLEPTDDALERLRRAVPARRTRKRMVLVGAATAVVLAGTAIPAALHLTGGEGAARPSAMAGPGEDPGGRTGGSRSGPHQSGSEAIPRADRSADGTPAAGGTTGGGPDPHTPAPTDGATEPLPDAAATTGADRGRVPPASVPGVPGCGAEQLRVMAAARAPEADGKVYGSFKVTNVSARGCTVTGPDTVTAASVTRSGPMPVQGTRVSVIGHRTGDPASGLPDPSAEAPLLLLHPDMAYEVRFAWVPSGPSCPAGGREPAKKPPQGVPPDTSVPASGGADHPPGQEPQKGGPAPEPPGITVSHTPYTLASGAPTTRTTIPSACGGTVYRTGVIPLDAPVR
ncbi:hypothetical protein [Streptomyces sp. NPDC051567]|uniref:hypothetical protein n=1 Tax=Streptomyces sp. NPDC051567 TaxID=3365660 RepID=UPI0037BB6849